MGRRRAQSRETSEERLVRCTKEAERRERAVQRLQEVLAGGRPEPLEEGLERTMVAMVFQGRVSTHPSVSVRALLAHQDLTDETLRRVARRDDLANSPQVTRLILTHRAVTPGTRALALRQVGYLAGQFVDEGLVSLADLNLVHRIAQLWGKSAHVEFAEVAEAALTCAPEVREVVEVLLNDQDRPQGHDAVVAARRRVKQTLAAAELV